MHTSVARIFITSFSTIVLHSTSLYTIVHYIVHPCMYLICHHCAPLYIIVLHCTKLYYIVQWCTMVYVHYIVPHLPPLSSSPTNCLPSQQPFMLFHPVQLIIENVHLSLTCATISFKLFQLNYKIYMYPSIEIKQNFLPHVFIHMISDIDISAYIHDLFEQSFLMRRHGEHREL